MRETVKIYIREPWWGAWKTFNWPKGTIGIGLDVKTVDKAIKEFKLLELRIGKNEQTYTISPVTVRNFAEKSGSKYKVRFNNELYVIPQKKLSKVKP